MAATARVARGKIRLPRSLADARSLAIQALIVLSIAALAWFLIDTTLANLRSRGIATGFAFLFRPVNMPIAHSWLEFLPGVHSYGRAIFIGLLNTLTVSFVVIAISTVLGTFIGIARLSPNWLLSRSCEAYVEVVRNVPVLLQLVFWYQLLLQLPPPRGALRITDWLFVSNRGIRYPTVAVEPSLGVILLALAVGIALTILAAKIRAKAGKPWRSASLWPVGLILTGGLPLAAALVNGTTIGINTPELRGFNFQGGAALTPELSALVIGLTVYSSAFVAEIVRAGILGVPKGQWEAAGALGLSKPVTLRQVILPQALRIIVPPLTSEYLGITKNSSLAVAVGYPDVVAIVNTLISDTGQAVEGIVIIMLAFLSISISVSLLMNWYNARVALVTR